MTQSDSIRVCRGSDGDGRFSFDVLIVVAAIGG